MQSVLSVKAADQCQSETRTAFFGQSALIQVNAHAAQIDIIPGLLVEKANQLTPHTTVNCVLTMLSRYS